MMGEPKRIPSETTRMLPECQEHLHVNGIRTCLSLAAQGSGVDGAGRGGTHVVICVSMKIRMKTRRAGIAEANIIHIGNVPVLPMG